MVIGHFGYFKDEPKTALSQIVKVTKKRQNQSSARFYVESRRNDQPPSDFDFVWQQNQNQTSELSFFRQNEERQSLF